MASGFSDLRFLRALQRLGRYSPGSDPPMPPGNKFGMQELEVCFVLLIALAQIGLPMIGVQQSFVLGVTVWAIFTGLLIHITWRWETARRLGSAGRVASTCVVLGVMALLLRNPLTKQYRSEHPSPVAVKEPVALHPGIEQPDAIPAPGPSEAKSSTSPKKVPKHIAPTDQLSQIRLYKPFEFFAPEAGKAAMVNVFWENYGPSTVELQTRAAIYISTSRTTDSIPMAEWANLENAVWKSFMKRRTPTSETITLPPEKRWVTISSPPLTQESADELLKNSGRVLLWIVGRFEWKMSDGEHKYDFCGFITGDPRAPRSCQHHNGP
jgi:hypothetical protein